MINITSSKESNFSANTIDRYFYHHIRPSLNHNPSTSAVFWHPNRLGRHHKLGEAHRTLQHGLREIVRTLSKSEPAGSNRPRSQRIFEY